MVHKKAVCFFVTTKQILQTYTADFIKGDRSVAKTLSEHADLYPGIIVIIKAYSTAVMTNIVQYWQ